MGSKICMGNGQVAPAMIVEKQVPMPCSILRGKDNNNKLVSKGNNIIDINGATDLGPFALTGAYYKNTEITGHVDFSSLTDITGGLNASGFYIGPLDYAFSGCTGITSVDLSGLTKISGWNGLCHTFEFCTNLETVNLCNLKEIIGLNNFFYVFDGCTKLKNIDLSSLDNLQGSGAFRNTALVNVDLSSVTKIKNTSSSMFQNCTSLKSVNLSNLVTVDAYGAMQGMFQNCTSLTSIDLNSLSVLKGSQCCQTMLANCTSLTTLLFPALTSTSFGSNTNQFYRMLYGVTGCTVHFPSNLQSVISSWSDVIDGFGGTNTTVLFDLPATE